MTRIFVNFNDTHPNGCMDKLPTVHYTRHEFRHLPEAQEAPLAVFCYDVPYLIVFNIFPPLPILNQIFITGGSQGGMSPGATWIPFQINSAEYHA